MTIAKGPYDPLISLAHCLVRGKEYILVPPVLWRYALGKSGREYDCILPTELMPTSSPHAFSIVICP